MLNYIPMTLTADSTIHEVLREKPESVDVLFRFGMGCIGCALAKGETIREAATAHGIPLAELLEALGISE
jgi:hybrid cluster-associated redox disulfide protein